MRGRFVLALVFFGLLGAGCVPGYESPAAPVAVSVDIQIAGPFRPCLASRVRVLDDQGAEYSAPGEACLSWSLLLPAGRTLGGVRADPGPVAYSLAVDAN